MYNLWKNWNAHQKIFRARPSPSSIIHIGPPPPPPPRLNPASAPAFPLVGLLPRLASHLYWSCLFVVVDARELHTYIYSTHVCVSTHTHMYCIVIDAHLSIGDQLVMHVFPLREIEVSTWVHLFLSLLTSLQCTSLSLSLFCRESTHE